jgi:hypothetical protein
MEAQQRHHLKVASVSLDSLTNQQLLQQEKVLTRVKRGRNGLRLAFR